MTGQWFSLGPLVSSTNKTDCHNITGILLKVALNTINPNPIHTFESRIFVLMKSVCMFSSVHQNITYVTPRGEVPPHGEQINVMLEKAEGTVKNWQSRDTGNNWHTRHRAKTNKTQKHSIAQKAKKTSNTDPTKNQGWNKVLEKGKQFLLLIRHTAPSNQIKIGCLVFFFISPELEGHVSYCH